MISKKNPDSSKIKDDESHYVGILRFIFTTNKPVTTRRVAFRPCAALVLVPNTV